MERRRWEHATVGIDHIYQHHQVKKKKKRIEKSILGRVNIIIERVIVVYHLLKLGRELSPGNRV